MTCRELNNCHKIVMAHSLDTQNISNRRRILLLAYACNPYRGGEHGVGWNWGVEIAKYFDTWVLCKEQKNREAIGNWITENGKVPGLHFVFVPNTGLERTLKKIPGLWYFVYNQWHRRAYRVALKLHRDINFELVHQVTINGFREPGYLWKLSIPFIWGPVGGTQNYPWRFLRHAGIIGGIKEGIRSGINALQLRYNPRVRMAIGTAEAVLVANSNGKEVFERIHKIKVIPMLETGVKDVIGPRPTEERQRPLNILWSGVFEHRKALHLLLLALSKIKDFNSYELNILGEGPLGRRWRRLARNLGIDSKCNWLGWLPYQQALQEYHRADLFIFTSLRDTSGNVVLEALSRGVPVICFDHQGVGDIVTDDCGLKIKVTRPRELLINLRDAISDFAENRKRLDALSEGAIARAHEYLWAAQGKRMALIYERVIASEGRRVN